ncbi:hypothetical protein Gogos_015349 [Gossypium gossypioides]|uniref:BHLH domain-containing protein n=1 Tax=Gossypium gossypioides TaxID=34282 RepID=A0A7J9C1H1_GOSGO|nr:hypothetical protein [Gossypium gossypioides]
MVATVTNHAELNPSIFSLGRETIAERIRALQERVPSVNKVNSFLFTVSHVCFFVQTDRAAMLVEIVDYVKFLKLQVKVSSTLLPVFSHISFSYFYF